MIDEIVVETSQDLAAGDLITAGRKGYIVHRGRVAETVPARWLFWIVDELIGSRHLLDMADLEIDWGRGAGKNIADGRFTSTPTGNSVRDERSNQGRPKGNHLLFTNAAGSEPA